MEVEVSGAEMEREESGWMEMERKGTAGRTQLRIPARQGPLPKARKEKEIVFFLQFAIKEVGGGLCCFFW